MKRTGFCLVGSHEGTRPLSPSGRALPTCKFWKNCSCSCHQELTEMFELGGRERILVDVSEYEPQLTGFWMPTPEFMAALRNDRTGGRVIGPADDETALGDAPRPTERAFAPTPSGYRARGQLESEVTKVCKAWDTGAGPVNLPLSFISQQINPHESPSVGAIREVLLRWKKYGFATMGEDPLSFTGFTPEGREQGIDVMRYKYEQRARLDRSKAERGYR